jgi:carbamoyltransferase
MSKEQVILGLQGFSKRTHNASACVVIDGQLVAMAEEERFSRRKNAFGEVPYNAMAASLRQANRTIEDVDGIALGWDYNKVFNQLGVTPPSQSDLHNLYLPNDRFPTSKRPEIVMYPHHQAHAASSYYLSGFDDSLVLVVDGQGESQSTSIFSARGDKIDLIEEFPVTDSLGYFYEAISEYVGLTRLDAGKTMGLASFGNPKHPLSLLKLTEGGYAVDIKPLKQTEMDLQGEVTKAWTDFLKKSFGASNSGKFSFDTGYARFIKELDFDQKYKDVAASGQNLLEEVALHLVSTYAPKYQHQNLSIAGGVGLNCSMNGFLAREGVVSDLFVPPFTNDAGVSVGAALLMSDKKPHTRLRSASLGPEFSNQQIYQTLNTLGVRAKAVDNISETVANLVAGNQIVDWFQGRMEAGPRALGNRSIIANPALIETHSRLNSVKNRENWRPLAPSILSSRLPDLVQDSADSPFMLRAFIASQRMAEMMPSAVHIDGTTRAQTVTSETNNLYFAMIEQFEKITGIPGVMNTSFNMDDEPIVCSPQNAVRTFFSSQADYLAIGDFLVAKR